MSFDSFPSSQTSGLYAFRLTLSTPVWYAKEEYDYPKAQVIRYCIGNTSSSIFYISRPLTSLARLTQTFPSAIRRHLQLWRDKLAEEKSAIASRKDQKYVPERHVCFCLGDACPP